MGWRRPRTVPSSASIWAGAIFKRLMPTRIQQFYSAYLNPYLNYHRPCAQADVEVDAKGRKRRRYRRYQTPLETLLSLPQPQQYLRPGLHLATLKRIAGLMSDTEAARRMQEAKHRLFEQLRKTA